MKINKKIDDKNTIEFIIKEFYECLNITAFSILMQIEGPLVLINLKNKIKENAQIYKVDINYCKVFWKGKLILTYTEPKVVNGYCIAEVKPLIKENKI